EGEITILELVNALGSGSELTQIKGLALRKNSSAYLTPPREMISDLNILPFPAWDLIDNRKYYHNPKLVHLRAKENYMVVFSSRGCPYGCSYCHNMFGKKFRSRNPENVFEEIHFLYKNYGVRQIEFWDDIFNFDRKRAEKILELIKASGMNMKLSFPNGLRADLLDKKMLKKMKEAGTVHIGVAVETASSGLQKAIRKNLNLEKVKDIIFQISKLGMMARGFFILGFPGETKKEMKKTIDFALKSKLHMASFFMLNPYKGSEIFFKAQNSGRNINTDYYSTGANSSTLNLSDVQLDEINMLVRGAYLAFYFRGVRLLRLFMRCPNKLLFLKQLFKYALQLLKRMKLVPNFLIGKGLQKI
ncbi:MAG: radical SAM protein, partial [Candidatus Omnitrophica bacterium]|nr:radical SAM protein [Candidatus Omnitrophota bacterium]